MRGAILSLDEAVKQNSNLVYGVCSKYQGYFDKEDLYQVGMLGLINAYKNFDISKKVKFSTYAFPYIVGEVSKYVRENKNIKISRDLIKLAKKINEYVEKFHIVKGYRPSIKELSSLLKIKEDKIISAMDCLNSVKSLDEEIIDDGKPITLLDKTIVEEKISNDQKLDLKDAINNLDENEKKLLINRYYNDYTQNEIAQELGVNQVYVSRLEKKALTKMKQILS